MKILLIETKLDLREIVTLTLETQFNAEVFEAGLISEGRELIVQHPEIDLVICGYHHEKIGITRQFVEGCAPVPVLLASSRKDQKFSIFARIRNVTLLERDTLLDDLQQQISKLVKAGKLQVSPLESRYCRIQTQQLIRVSPLQSDIYIRLNKEKFIKLMREGDVFDVEDLRRYYLQKKVEYLYFRCEDAGEFIQKVNLDLKSILERKPLDKTLARIQAYAAQEAMQELSQKLGFTEEVQEFVRNSVKLTVAMIGRAPKIREALARMAQNRDQYIALHSTALAELSCSIAAISDWNSETTFSKLTMAALFHDIMLKNQRLAAVQTLEELDPIQSHFQVEELTGFKLHPIHAAEMLRQMKEVPADVDSIIMQHHERPDGSGFPRGLMGTQIGPLATIFILAHDLYNYILDAQTDTKGKKLIQPRSVSIEEFIAISGDRYKQGLFKRITQEMRKVKL